MFRWIFAGVASAGSLSGGKSHFPDSMLVVPLRAPMLGASRVYGPTGVIDLISRGGRWWWWCRWGEGGCGGEGGICSISISIDGSSIDLR